MFLCPNPSYHCLTSRYSVFLFPVFISSSVHSFLSLVFSSPPSVLCPNSLFFRPQSAVISCKLPVLCHQASVLIPQFYFLSPQSLASQSSLLIPHSSVLRPQSQSSAFSPGAKGLGQSSVLSPFTVVLISNIK